MAQILGFLSTLISIYMMIVVFRVILTWFSGMGQGKVTEIVSKITDPYLNWFRNFGIFKAGSIDFSPIVALGVLSLVNRAFSILAVRGSISIGIILAMLVQAVWGVASFLIGFMIIVFILRLIAHYANLSGYFWRIVESITQPVLYRINRFVLKDRIINYGTSIIISIAIFGIGYIVLLFAINLLSAILSRLPI